MKQSFKNPPSRCNNISLEAPACFSECRRTVPGECPDLTLQIDDFEKLVNMSADRTIIYSPWQYSKEGYAFRIATILFDQTSFGLYAQIISGDFDDQLEFPCLQRQLTLQMLDQNPNIQLQMSKQFSVTTSNGKFTRTNENAKKSKRKL